MKFIKKIRVIVISSLFLFSSALLTHGSDMPYGVPVQGKPGFVKSPFAPFAGYVDVSGMSRGEIATFGG